MIGLGSNKNRNVDICINIRFIDPFSKSKYEVACMNSLKNDGTVVSKFVPSMARTVMIRVKITNICKNHSDQHFAFSHVKTMTKGNDELFLDLHSMLEHDFRHIED